MTEELFIHPNLKQLSHSSSTGLHKCLRRYQLDKLLPRPEFSDDDDDPHLNFGKLVGLGVQEYLITGSVDAAYWKMFLSWQRAIDDETGEKKRKTFWHALYSIKKFEGLRKTVFGNYQLAYFDGKPAVELGFKIDLGDGFYYRGFIDAVLIDMLRQELVALECKTTTSREVHEAVFKHSGQALGYSVILDVISKLINVKVGSSYRVVYPIYKTFSLEWDPQFFTKKPSERALWIRNALYDKQIVTDRVRDDFFPMRGEFCYDFFRPCPHFGTCEVSDKYLIGDLSEVEERVEKEDKYQFTFTIDEIIDAQLALHTGE